MSRPFENLDIPWSERIPKLRDFAYTGMSMYRESKAPNTTEVQKRWVVLGGLWSLLGVSVSLHNDIQYV